MVQQGHAADVIAAALSDDGRLLATGSRDDTARLWATVTGEELRTFRGHGDDVTAVALSADGSRLATGGRDDTVRLWDTLTGAEVATLQGHAFAVTSLSFSADGATLVSGSEDHHAIAWNVAEARELRRVGGRPDYASVTAVTMVGDGRRVMIAFDDGTARQFDLKRGRETACLGAPGPAAATALAIHGDEVLVGDARGGVRLWRLAGPTSLWSAGAGDEPVVAVGLRGADGPAVAVTADGSLRTFDRGSGREVSSAATGRPVSAACVHAGHTVLATGRQLRTVSGDTSAVDVEFGARTVPVRFVAALTDGSLSIVAADRDVRQLAHRDGEDRVRTLAGTDAAVRVVAQSADGRWLAAGTDDEGLWLWDLRGQEAPRPLEAHRGAVDALAFSPDGARLASGSADRRICLWATDSASLLSTLVGHERAVVSLAFSADGQRLVSGGWDASARLWDVVTGDPVLRLDTPGHFVQAVALSPDGERIATGNGDNTISLWAVEDGSEQLNLAAHGNAVWALAFSSDGQLLLSGGGGGEATVWAVESGVELASLPGHGGPVSTVAFGPGDRWMITGGADARARLWSTGSQQALCTVVCGDDGTWSVVDREGRYAGTTPGHHRGVHWVQQREPIPLVQGSDAHHRPGLLAETLAIDAPPPDAVARRVDEADAERAPAPHLWAVIAAATRSDAADGDLRYAARDAAELAAALEHAAAAHHGPDRTHVELLTGDALAVGAPLQASLANAAGATAGDTLVLVLAGFGGVDERGILLWQAGAGDPVTGHDLVRWTEGIAAERRILVLDLCDTAPAVRDLSDGVPPSAAAAPAAAHLREAGGFQVLLGRSSDRASHEASPTGRGWLTDALLAELAAGEEPLAAVPYLEAVEVRVAEAVKATPGVGSPLRASDEDRDFQFALPAPARAQAERPLFLRPDARWVERGADALEIAEATRDVLLQRLGDGTGPAVYVDALSVGAGYRSLVVYTVEGNRIEATVRVLHGAHDVASFEVTGDRGAVGVLGELIAVRLMAIGEGSATP